MVQRHYRAHRARRAALAMGDRERVRARRRSGGVSILLGACRRLVWCGSSHVSGSVMSARACVEPVSCQCRLLADA